MSSLKVKFRKSSVTDQPGSIVYAFTHGRKTRIITSDYKIYPEEWNNATSQVIIPTSERREICESISQRINWDLERFRHIVSSLTSSEKSFDTDDAISIFRQQNERQWFFRFMDSQILRLQQLGKRGTAKNYRAALNSLVAFRDSNDLLMQEITPSFIEEYQAWLADRGVKTNSISFYMRILRAVYLRAVDKGYVQDKRPFKHAYTKIEKTIKRSISISDIKRIKDLDLSNNLSLEKARDIFLFLFYTRGMSFIDAAFLKKSDIIGGEIHYRRHKTNQYLTIGVNAHIEHIIKKYSRDESDYLLPIIINKNADERTQYESALRLTNNALKKIARLADVYANLTTYTVRHSWATIAKQKGVATATISDALGHDSEKTTQIYLASISSNVLAQANDLVLQDL